MDTCERSLVGAHASFRWSAIRTWSISALRLAKVNHFHLHLTRACKKPVQVMEACLAFKRVLRLIGRRGDLVGLRLLLLQGCFAAQACPFLAILLPLLFLQCLLLGFGVGIDEVHGCIDALGNPYLHSFNSPILATGEQDTLIARWYTQYVVCSVYALLARAANAHAQAWELVGVQVANDALQPVVPGSTPLRSQANLAYRQIEFVIDHQYIFWLHFIPAHKFSH